MRLRIIFITQIIVRLKLYADSRKVFFRQWVKSFPSFRSFTSFRSSSKGDNLIKTIYMHIRIANESSFLSESKVYVSNSYFTLQM